MTSATAQGDTMTATIKRLEAEVEGLKAGNNSMRKALWREAEQYCAMSGTPVCEWRDYVADEHDKTDDQCLAQVKHDAIMTMQAELVKQVSSECRCGALDDVDNFIYEYSQELLTQAQEQNT